MLYLARTLSRNTFDQLKLLHHLKLLIDLGYKNNEPIEVCHHYNRLQKLDKCFLVYNF